MSLSNRNYEVALNNFRPLAIEGNAQAQLALGFMLLNGLGEKADPSTAIKWYEKASAQGEPDALVALGSIYRDGIFVEKDAKTAIKLLTSAAQQKHMNAMLLLGLMYQEADGVSLDYVKAAMWYEISMRFGGDASFATLIADEMDVDELKLSKQLATQCIESNFEKCGQLVSNDFVVSELYCTLTNVQGGILGQNNLWATLGENNWTKTILPEPFSPKSKGTLTLGPGMLLNYKIIDIQGLSNVLEGAIFLDLEAPGFQEFNEKNRYSNASLRLQYRCYDQKLTFIRDVFGE